jgi:hypothetical protein
MTLKKLSLFAVALLSLATLSAGGAFALVRTSTAQDGPAGNVRTERQEPASPVQKAAFGAVDELADKKEELVRLALERYELEYKLHLEGELPFADLVQLCDALESAELQATNPARTVAMIKEHSLNRLRAIEQGATNLVKTGNLRMADLKAIQIRRLQAEIDLKTPDDQKLDAPSLLQRVNALEKKVQELEKRLPAGGSSGSK